MSTDMKVLCEIVRGKKRELLMKTTRHGKFPWQSNFDGPVFLWLYNGTVTSLYIDYQKTPSMVGQAGIYPICERDDLHHIAPYGRITEKNFTYARVGYDTLETVTKECGELVTGAVPGRIIREFNWDFDIHYNCMTTKDEYNDYMMTGRIPETIATYMSDGVKVKFSRSFKGMYPKYLKEVKYLESLGNDFNLLFYFY